MWFGLFETSPYLQCLRQLHLVDDQQYMSPVDMLMSYKFITGMLYNIRLCILIYSFVYLEIVVLYHIINV